jgi:uncharacterized protein (TIGR03086 family)
MIDIAPAANRMAGLLTSVSDDWFDLPTPCPDSSVGDLIDHVGVFSKVFAAVAHKDSLGSSPPPRPSAVNLEAGWRDRIARDLEALADAWGAAEAWEGMTAIRGLELPAQVGGLVALDELVVHGWDIAVSTGQPYEPSAAEVDAAASFVSSFDAPRDGGLFGPVVPVPDDASPLNRLLGLTGRDPGWHPPAG